MRHAATQRAAEHHHVGSDAVHLGSAAAGQAEAGQGLVENDASARGPASVDDAAEVLGLRRHDAELLRDRIQHHRGQVDADLGHRRLEGLEVAPRHDADQAGHLGRDPGDQRLAVAVGPGGGDLERLDGAAPVAVEHDHPVAPRVASAPAQRQLPREHLGRGADPRTVGGEHLAERFAELHLGGGVEAAPEPERRGLRTASRTYWFP